MKHHALLAAVAVCIVLLALPASAECPPGFGYSGFTIPDQWRFVEGWEACSTPSDTRARQSPVDLQESTFEIETGGDPILIGWGEDAFDVENSGHDFRITMKDEASTITIGSEVFVLQNVHLHTRSEHTINGSHMDAEAHFVHEDADEDIVVIAVFFRRTAQTSEAWRPIFNALPVNLCRKNPMGSRISLVDLLPREQRDVPRTEVKNYWRYVGSLTTPKCTEGVRFFFVRPFLEISAGDLQKLATFGENRRTAIFPLYDRKVYDVRP